jgi:hypothetical protein
MLIVVLHGVRGQPNPTTKKDRHVRVLIAVGDGHYDEVDRNNQKSISIKTYDSDLGKENDPRCVEVLPQTLPKRTSRQCTLR